MIELNIPEHKQAQFIAFVLVFCILLAGSIGYFVGGQVTSIAYIKYMDSDCNCKKVEIGLGGKLTERAAAPIDLTEAIMNMSREKMRDKKDES